MNPDYAAVAARAAHRCEYCRAPEAVFNFPFEVEHVIPPRHGGSDEPSNLALACRSCNLFKSDSIAGPDLKAHSTVRLFHPRLDRWEDHFIMEKAGTIEGLTDVGRATVEQLRMNAQSQVAAREYWRRLGLLG